MTTIINILSYCTLLPLPQCISTIAPLLLFGGLAAALTWHLRDHLKRSQTPKGSQNSQVEWQRLLHNYGHAPDRVFMRNSFRR